MTGRKPEDHRKYLGQRFGKLLINSISHKDKNSIVFVLVACDCGREKPVRLSDLKSGRTISCGCYIREQTRKKLYKHGKTGTRLHNNWLGMKDRCNNPQSESYPRYGGRGINVCADWQDSFQLFERWCLDNGFRDDLTLDRIDNNGDYSPENCRWADAITQANNKRNNVFVTYKDKTQTVSQWARDLGIRQQKLDFWLKKGRTIDELISNETAEEIAKKLD